MDAKRPLTSREHGQPNDPRGKPHFGRQGADPDRPTLEAFKSACRAELNFLISEYGFVERDLEPTPSANPYRVRFARDDLEVLVEGLNYGLMASVTIRDRRGRTLHPLLLDPAFVLGDRKYAGRSKGQLDDIRREARYLREHGGQLLAGDLSVLDDAIARRDAMHAAQWAAYDSRRRYGIAVQEAVAAFRLEQWGRVVALLEPHEAALSHRMARKLAVARQSLKQLE